MATLIRELKDELLEEETREASQTDFNDVNFGNIPPLGSIAGVKFNDINGNALRDPGEPGLPNFTIYVDANINGVFDPNEPSSITDADGNYFLSNLLPGVYPVREIQQPGFGQTTPDPFLSINGDNITNIDIGNAPSLGSIAGVKFNDINANGFRDAGEPGLPNFTIYLDTNNNSVLDSGEPGSITDANGNYSFNGIPSGVYPVREVQQPGFVQTTGDRVINLNGENFSNIDIGNAPPLGSIAGVKFNDFNGNGFRDAGEPGLPNFTIYLDTNNNNILDSGEASSITDANGNYLFGNIPSGVYPVREVQQPGFAQTTPDPVINLNGENFNNIDIGNAPPLGSIAGVKFNDFNGNGFRDAGEPGIDNFTIFLDLNNNGALEDNEPRSITDANGNYFFSGLPSGVYVVKELQQQAFRQTTADPVIDLNGENFSNIDIGNTAIFGSISGTKYSDLNANGIRDAGEIGLENVTIYLDNNNNDILDPEEPISVTDSQGNYNFTGLPSGIYVVREVPQFGLTQTTNTPVINLNGETFTDINIGNVGSLSAIAGVKFNDLNNNGIRDTGEPGLGNFTLYLDNNNNNIFDPEEASTVTDADGNYLFANLPSATYIIRELQQPGFVQTTPDRIVTVNGNSFNDINIGNSQAVGSIRGVKFNDFNANGVRDIGEPGLSDFTIYLDINENNVFDTGEPASITDANGNYFFDNLPPGRYTVREVQQPGFVQTTPDPVVVIDPSASPNTVTAIGNDALTGPLSQESITGSQVFLSSGSTDAGESGEIQEIARFDGGTVEDLLGGSSGESTLEISTGAMEDMAIAIPSETGEFSLV